MSKVFKFGGSSVAGAQAMEYCLDIIKSHEDLKLVVFSATYNTTNLLEEFAALSVSSVQSAMKFFDETILERHHGISRELDVESETNSYFKDLEEEATFLAESLNKKIEIQKDIMDQVYSLGERFSSFMLSHYIRKNVPNRDVVFLDARDVIATDSSYGKASPLQYQIRKNINAKEFGNSLVITQGFIGKTVDGKTTTFGREGSDYSAALFARAFKADSLTIWTDVDGIYSTDPKKVEQALPIRSISYDHATDMAEAGAKVLFPRTLLPAKKENIDVYVKSTFLPDGEGTKITMNSDVAFFGVASEKEDELVRVKVFKYPSFDYEKFDLEETLHSICDKYELCEQDDHFFTLKIDPEHEHQVNELVHSHFSK